MKHSNSSQRSEQNGKLKENKDKSLEHHFNQLKQENYDSTFPEVESWIYKASVNLQNNYNLTNSNERLLHKMKNFFFGTKLRLVYTIIAFVVLIGACNMPVTQTETAGQMITLAVNKSDNDFASKMQNLPWIKSAQVTSNENVNNGVDQIVYRIVLPNATEEQVRAYSKELETIGDISTIKITPMDYDVKRPLYSAALHDFFSINIDATGMSDDELKTEIESKLKEQGVDMKFQFKTGPDGRREIRMEQDGKIDVNNEPKSFEMNIEDNNGREKIKLFTKKADPKQFEGKTDEQIREMVKKDFGNENIKDSDIIIERKDGKVQVKINKDVKEVK
ncbi:MAG: hypothetical protein J0M37_07140 [Ignavibacteria bacterium]|nr:hypothetical protein [Ignavibacteria bacterium]